jgi:ribosome assembly protein YihI (activator of Der GTPase)
MAMYLIKDDHLHAPRGDDPIWELAETLSMEIGDWKEKIDEICDMLDDLSLLAPDPDEEDEADDFDANED